jgi:hypothetical protein
MGIHFTTDPRIFNAGIPDCSVLLVDCFGSIAREDLRRLESNLQNRHSCAVALSKNRLFARLIARLLAIAWWLGCAILASAGAAQKASPHPDGGKARSECWALWTPKVSPEQTPNLCPLVSEQRLDIPATMHHVQEQNVTIFNSIDDNIATYRQAPQAGTQVMVPPTA